MKRNNFKTEIYALFLILLSSLNSSYGQIDWQLSSIDGVSWALACDFTNNDLSSAKVPGEKCGETCLKTYGCTHFTWNNYEGGTCWMKTNLVSKNDAKFTNNYNMVCGLVPSSFGTGTDFIYFSNKIKLNNFYLIFSIIKLCFL